MKLDKLLKKLKRDLTASPLKAGALGLMVFVALYFWAPLVMKFLGTKGKGPIVAAAQVILTDDPILTQVVAHPATDTARWERIRQALTQDQLMTAAAHRVEWENPFRRLNEPAAQPKSGEPTESANPEQTGPATPPLDKNAAQELAKSLTISTLLIGPRECAAMIRGTVYRVGDIIELGGENGEPKLEFRVIGIDADGVDLDFPGGPLRLTRPKPKLSPGAHLKST